MTKQHVVRLTDRHRETLSGSLSSGGGRARELMHARILLKADQSPHGPG